MAATVGRICGKGLLKSSPRIVYNQTNKLSTTREWVKSRKTLLAAVGAITGGAGALVLTLENSVKASDLELHPPKYPWYQNGFLRSHDHAAVRRGYEVYKQVCSACHSLQYVCYRELVGASHTEAEAKAEAEQIMVTDGPDEEGNMYQRPGKLSDHFPDPYANENAARAANNGAFPPDLSYIVYARHGGEDYIFSLLTGYCDPPAGMVVREGQNYNPYFPGGAISMAQILFNESITYEDGTPASASQLAKDVSCFLRWTADPFLDDRMLIAIRTLSILAVMYGLTLYYKRFKWSALKSRKIEFVPKKKSDK